MHNYTPQDLEYWYCMSVLENVDAMDNTDARLTRLAEGDDTEIDNFERWLRVDELPEPKKFEELEKFFEWYFEPSC